MKKDLQPFKLPDQVRQRLTILFANLHMSVHIVGTLQDYGGTVETSYLLNSKIAAEKLVMFEACKPLFQQVLDVYLKAAFIVFSRGQLTMLRLRMSPEGHVEGFRVTPRDGITVDALRVFNWKTGHEVYPYES